MLSLTTLLMVGTISTFVSTPVQAAASASPRLSVQFTCAQAVDLRSGRICVHTQPHAALAIKIRYCTNYYAVSRSLKGTQIADIRGNYTWTWVPNTKCRGAAIAYVTETYSRRTLNAWTRFVVR